MSTEGKFTAYVAFGSNLGRPRVQLNRAVRALARRPGVRVISLSRLYRTAAVGGPRQPDYMNAVAKLRVTLPPRTLLSELLNVERSLGRRRGRRWGPRTIDLDLLAHGQSVLRSRGLTLPHPRLHKRRFVLLPLLDVAPRWRHPVLKRRTLKLLRQLTPPDQRVTILGKWIATPSSPSGRRSRKSPPSSR